MAKTLKPLSDRVLVRRIEEDQSRGNIVIPDAAKEKPVEGEVLAVGPGHRETDGTVTPLTVKEGDKVLFGKYSGAETNLDGEDVVVMREEEILGILID